MWGIFLRVTEYFIVIQWSMTCFTELQEMAVSHMKFNETYVKRIGGIWICSYGVLSIMVSTYSNKMSIQYWCLRGYCTSYPKISMFCALTQNHQHLLKNKLYYMWRVTAKGTLTRLLLVSDSQTFRSQSIVDIWRDNKLAQPWFSHLGTKESNKRVIP